MGRIGRWASTLWEGTKTRLQVEALGPAAAADIGVTLADVCAAARRPGDVPDRMARMAALFGAEAGLSRLARCDAQDMAHACAGCMSRAACARALYGKGKPDVAQVSFCPNASTYRGLAASAARQAA